MAYWEALLRACNPSILSNQSALFQQEHISTVTVGSFTTSGVGWGQEGVAWKESERTILMFWHEVFRSTPHPAFLLIQVSERAVGQSLLAGIFDCDVLDANVHHCTRLVSFFSLSLSIQNKLLFFLSVVSIQPSFQPSAAVRGFHGSKSAAMGPSLGSNWTSGSSGGQGAWSGPSFTRASLQHYISHQQQHAQHHPQSTHTSYAYCPAHTAVSTVNFLCLHLSVISSCCVAIISLNTKNALLVSLSLWSRLVAVTIREALTHAANSFSISSSHSFLCLPL